jgi:hypothetical protein
VRTAAVVAVGGALVFLVVAWLAKPWVVGDTSFVLDGSNAFLTCLSNHDFSACGYTGRLNDAGLMTPVGDWPLLQHLPDLAAIGLGADRHATRSRILELLGVAGVVVGVVSAWLALTRTGQRAWFWAFMLTLLSSPLLWYARTTFGEALAAGLLVCFVAATVVPAHPVVVALAATAAAWTKETTYPFLVALGVLGLLVAARRTGVRVRGQLIGLGVGLLAAIVAASLFNVVRYGKVISPNFFEAQLHTPGFAHKLEYSVAVLVSPSGGMLVFWPVATVLVLAALIVGVRSRERLDVVAAAVVLLVIAGLTLGFASWWTPFGWAAYGNRLAVPWGLPLALFVLVVWGERLRPYVARLLAPPWRLAVVFAVVLAFTLPSIGTMWRPDSTGSFFLQGEGCERPWLGGVEQWQRCQERYFWGDRPMPLYGLHGVATPSGAVTTVIVALGLLGCLMLLRGELVPAQQQALSRATGLRFSGAASTSPEA